MASDDVGLLLFKAAFAALAWWVVWRARRPRRMEKADRASSGTGNSEAGRVISMLGGPKIAPLVLQLVAHKSVAQRRARTFGWVAVALVVALTLAGPVPAVLSTNATGWIVHTQFAMVAVLALNIAVASRVLIQRRLYRADRLVVLLRRFRAADKRHTILAEEVGHVCAAMAVPFTVQDQSFRGQPPTILAAAKSLLIPLVFLPLLFACGLFALSVAPNGGWATGALWLGASGGLIWLIDTYAGRLIVRLGVVTADERTFRERLERVVARVRARSGFYVGTRVITFPDTVWQDGVEFMLRAADAVIVDVSDVSEAVAWELSTVARLIPPEQVVLVWQIEGQVERQIREHIRVAVRGSAANDADPMHAVRSRLAPLLGEEWVARCHFASYEATRRRPTNWRMTTRVELLHAISRALAFGQLTLSSGAVKQAT